MSVLTRRYVRIGRGPRDQGIESRGRGDLREVEALFAMKRREFIKLAGAVSAESVARAAKPTARRNFAIVIDAGDPVAGSGPVRWAAEELRSAIAAKGALCRVADSLNQARGATVYVFVNAIAVNSATSSQKTNSKPTGAEHFQLVPGRMGTAPVVLVLGSDVRGYVYGLLELAERVRFGTDPALFR